MEAVNSIEDMYNLSPMQQGMLFHTLHAPNSGVYCEQTSYSLTGKLNVSAFKQTWWQVVQRHSILRTAFYWEELSEPLQVVYRQAVLPWIEEDWRGLSAREQQARFEAFLEADRGRGFALGQARRQNAPKHSASGRGTALKCPDPRPKTCVLDSSRAHQYSTFWRKRAFKIPSNHCGPPRRSALSESLRN